MASKTDAEGDWPPVFDAAWYCENYPDIALAGVDPLQHYLEHGAREGRSPHPLFDAEWYLSRYPDVSTSGLTALEHYFEIGASIGNDPHPLFCTSWYLERYPEVAVAAINPLLDFLHGGAAAGRDPKPDFRVKDYVEQNPELAATGQNPLVHYLERGQLLRPRPGQRRIQLFRSGELGDVLLITPTLRALRARHPDDEIVVATSFTEILEGNPHIDHLVRARAPLKGADETYCLEYETHPEEHIVEGYARVLGLTVDDRTPEIYLSQGERISAAEQLRAAGIRAFERFCVLQITAAWQLRNWDVGRFRALAAILESRGFRVVVLGNNAEPNIDFGVDLRGQTDLRQVSAIIEKCALMVTIDSGLMHIGLAFRKPVVSLFGPTDPTLRLPDWALATSLFSDLECRGCSHRVLAVPMKPVPRLHPPRCIFEKARCMDRLTVDAVAGRVAAEIERLDGPLVSIVLLHYLKYPLVEACLSSIFHCGARCPFEVIVVANGSPAENLAGLQAWHPNIRILRLEENQTFAAAMNAGARAARGRYLLLLNDDTTVTPGWLDELVEFAQNDPQVGIVGPKLLFPENNLIQHCGIAFNEKGLGEHIFKFVKSSFPAANRVRYFRALTGACLLITRDLFLQLGGFDLAYTRMGGCEDVDLCFKVLKYGKLPAYCPSSIVYHHEGLTRGIRDEFHPEDLHNRQVLRERWNRYLTPDISDYYLLAEIEAEEAKSWRRLAEVSGKLLARYDTPERRLRVRSGVERERVDRQVGFG